MEDVNPEELPEAAAVPDKIDEMDANEDKRASKNHGALVPSFTPTDEREDADEDADGAMLMEQWYTASRQQTNA